MKILVNGKSFRVDLKEISSNKVLFEVNNRNYLVEVENSNNLNNKEPSANPKSSLTSSLQGDVKGASKLVYSQIPGLVHSVLVKVGEKIKAGDSLLLLEAMKMQNRVISQTAGTVKAIFVNDGDEVTKGQQLVEIK